METKSPDTATLAAVCTALAVQYGRPTRERAQEVDPPVVPRPMQAAIDGTIPVDELARRLKAGGLEMFPDCAGNYFIRTIEAGDAHRAQVRAEREAERVARGGLVL